MRIYLAFLVLLTVVACGDPEPETFTCGETEVTSCIDCAESPLLCATDGRCVADCQAACPGSTNCGVSECVYLDSDPDHCGACNNPCAKNEGCSEASCQCEEGYSDCDEFPGNGCETDVFEDDENCGACGLDCGDGYDCCEGRCRFVRADPQHCGGCGVECNVGDICLEGNCLDTN